MDFSEVGAFAGEDVVTGIILVTDAAHLGDRVALDAVLDGEPFCRG